MSTTNEVVVGRTPHDDENHLTLRAYTPTGRTSSQEALPGLPRPRVEVPRPIPILAEGVPLGQAQQITQEAINLVDRLNDLPNESAEFDQYRLRGFVETVESILLHQAVTT